MRAMSEDKIKPGTSPRGETEAALRRLRQAEALRANLARRKSQSRGRSETDEDNAAADTAAPETPKAPG